MDTMETAFSSGRSTPLNWDECEDNATCDEVAEFLDDDDEELQSLQVSVRNLPFTSHCVMVVVMEVYCS